MDAEVGAWVHECMDVWVHSCLNGRMGGRVSKRAGGQVDRWTNKWTNGMIDRAMDGWIVLAMGQVKDALDLSPKALRALQLLTTIKAADYERTAAARLIQAIQYAMHIHPAMCVYL